MIRNCIVRDYSKYARAYGFDGTDYDTEIEYQSLKERMRTNAIHDNGIAKTFCFSDHCYKLTLDYIKIEDEDIELYPDMFEQKSDCRLIYLCDDPPDESLFNPYNSLEFQDILSSCLLYNEIDDTLNREFEIIKKECVEKYNAVYSSVNIDNVEINKYHKIIYIHYSYHYIKDEEAAPRCTDCSTPDPKIIIANPNQNFTIDDDKLCMSLKYGKYTSYSLILTKEVFQECYNRWIKPQEEGNSIEQ